MKARWSLILIVLLFLHFRCSWFLFVALMAVESSVANTHSTVPGCVTAVTTQAPLPSCTVATALLRFAEKCKLYCLWTCNDSPSRHHPLCLQTEKRSNPNLVSCRTFFLVFFFFLDHAHYECVSFFCLSRAEVPIHLCLCILLDFFLSWRAGTKPYHGSFKFDHISFDLKMT